MACRLATGSITPWPAQVLVVFTSVLVGLATGAAYWALGLENAAVWGVVAAVLNLAPYIGSALVTGSSALVAFLQFGTLDMAMAIGGASLVIHTLIGNLLTDVFDTDAAFSLALFSQCGGLPLLLDILTQEYPLNLYAAAALQNVTALDPIEACAKLRDLNAGCRVIRPEG
jgi:hypothetical protein